MAASNSPRAKALRGLKGLMGPSHRVQKHQTPFEAFGFVITGIDPASPPERDIDDRAIALVVATVLEHGLEGAILEKLVPLPEEEERSLFYEDSAPLGTFDAKIRLSYALGILGKEAKQDFLLFKHIRNCFAHSRLPIDFETPEIKQVCSLFTIRDRIGDGNFLTGKINEREDFIQFALTYAINIFGHDFHSPLDPIGALILDLDKPPESQ